MKNQPQAVESPAISCAENEEGAGWCPSRSCLCPGTSCQTQIPQFLLPGGKRAHMHSFGCSSICARDILRSYSTFLLFESRKASSRVWGRHMAVLLVTLTPLAADLCHLSVFRPFSVSLQSFLQHMADPAPCRGNFWPCGFPVLIPSSFCSSGTWIVTGWGTAGQTWHSQGPAAFSSLSRKDCRFHNESTMTKALREIPSTA